MVKYLRTTLTAKPDQARGRPKTSRFINERRNFLYIDCHGFGLKRTNIQTRLPKWTAVNNQKCYISHNNLFRGEEDQNESHSYHMYSSSENMLG